MAKQKMTLRKALPLLWLVLDSLVYDNQDHRLSWEILTFGSNQNIFIIYRLYVHCLKLVTKGLTCSDWRNVAFSSMVLIQLVSHCAFVLEYQTAKQKMTLRKALPLLWLVLNSLVYDNQDHRLSWEILTFGSNQIIFIIYRLCAHCLKLVTKGLTCSDWRLMASGYSSV